jgi:hypothetical protein
VTYFESVHGWEPEKREAFVAWIEGEGLDPYRVVDDGRFSVHNGRVSGHLFIVDDEGQRVVDRRHNSLLKVPFNLKQKNPLPEGL